MSLNITDIKSSAVKKTAKSNTGLVWLNFKPASISDKEKEAFYSDISILIASGIDIKTSIELILKERTKNKKTEIFESIRKSLINGKSFSEAISITNKFSAYEYYSLKIGEESGNISEILNELSSFYNDKTSQKRQIINAISYPVLVLVVAVVVVIFMMNVIVPMFKDVFSRFNGELPVMTKMVITLSEAFSENIYIFLFVALASIIFYFYSREKLWFKKAYSQLLLKLPFVGVLVSKVYLARFCHSMALLIGARVPLINTLELVKNMIGFYPYEEALKKIIREVAEGKSLFLSMKKHKIFDERTVSLVQVAEEVNQLDSVFKKLNQQYSIEVKHKIGLLNGVLEPLLIIFIGIIVAVILISMYLPLFQLSSSVY
ncbi:MAG: type II secretion system F family protein [Bacteroidales bacterium]|nr:type II secretion system F family protein [Bacteroidales bacterium]